MIKKIVIVVLSCLFLAQGAHGIEFSDQAQALIATTKEINSKKDKILIHRKDFSRVTLGFGLFFLGLAALIRLAENNSMRQNDLDIARVYEIFFAFSGGLMTVSGFMAQPKPLVMLDDKGITFIKDKKKLLWADLEDIQRDIGFNNLLGSCIYFIKKSAQDAKPSEKISVKKLDENLAIEERLLPIKIDAFISLVSEYIDQNAIPVN